MSMHDPGGHVRLVPPLCPVCNTQPYDPKRLMCDQCRDLFRVVLVACPNCGQLIDPDEPGNQYDPPGAPE